jgi:hypothetical protein
MQAAGTPREQSPQQEQCVSGSSSSFYQSFITDSDRNAIKVTMDVINSEGIAGLFRGLTSTMAREMPGYFFFFGGV